MKKTLHAFLAGVIVLTLAASAIAQGPGPRGGAPGRPGGPGMGRGGGFAERMKKMNDEIFAKLKLTKDQKTKVKALQDKTIAQTKKLMEGGQKGGNMQGNRSKFMEIQKGYNDGLAKILSKDQMKKYTELRKAAREKMRAEFMKRGPGGPGGAQGGPRPRS